MESVKVMISVRNIENLHKVCALEDIHVAALKISITSVFWLQSFSLFVFLVMSSHVPIPSERASKLRRLEALRRDNPHVSASALSALLEDIEQHGMPDLTGKKHVKEARDYTLHQHTAYGPMLETVELVNTDGTSQGMVVVNMCTLLQALFQMDGGITSLIKSTFVKTPPTVDSPWSPYIL